jgi:hypothetical protein
MIEFLFLKINSKETFVFLIFIINVKILNINKK